MEESQPEALECDFDIVRKVKEVQGSPGRGRHRPNQTRYCFVGPTRASTEGSFPNDSLPLGRMCLNKQAQICSCALLQLAYDSQLGKVPEFISSTEKTLVPGGSCFLADRDRPSLSAIE